MEPDLYLHSIYNTSRHTHTCMWFSLRLEMTFSWSSLRTLYRMARLSLSFFSMNKPLSLSSGDGGTERSSDTEPSSGTLQHKHTHKVTREAHKTRHEVNRWFTAVCSLIYLQIQASPGYSVCKGKCRSSMSQRCVTCMHACTLVLDWCVQSHQLKLVKLSGLVKLVL